MFFENNATTAIEKPDLPTTLQCHLALLTMELILSVFVLFFFILFTFSVAKIHRRHKTLIEIVINYPHYQLHIVIYSKLTFIKIRFNPLLSLVALDGRYQTPEAFVDR